VLRFPEKQDRLQSPRIQLIAKKRINGTAADFTSAAVPVLLDIGFAYVIIYKRNVKAKRYVCFSKY